MSYPLPERPHLGTIDSMKKLLTALSVLTLCCASNAQAQIDFNFDGSAGEEEGPKVINPYDDKFKPDIAIQGDGTSISLLPNYYYEVDTVRKPGASPDDINFSITSPGSITGCLNTGDPTISTAKSANILRIEIIDGFIDVDNNTVRYAQYECKPGTASSQMSLTLSKNQLREDGINRLTFISGQVGPFYDIMIDIQDTHITITPQSLDLSRFGVSTPQPTSGPTKYWNYPDNTIALFSSSADLNDEEAMKSARALARKNGLTPLDEIISGFRPNIEHSNKLFAVDTEGRFNDKLKEQNDVFALGTIEQAELYFGPQGAYNKPVEQTIFARRPGPNE